MENYRTRILNTLRRWRFNYISRRQLLTLDNRSLKDLGISRADALLEGSKPFWRGASSTVNEESAVITEQIIQTRDVSSAEALR